MHNDEHNMPCPNWWPKMKSVLLTDDDIRIANGKSPEEWAEIKRLLFAEMPDWVLPSDRFYG